MLPYQKILTLFDINVLFPIILIAIGLLSLRLWTRQYVMKWYEFFIYEIKQF